MCEKRFIKKDYDYDGCFFFDREQEFTDNVNKIPFYDVENLIPMTDEQVVELLNGFCDENEKLEKELEESSAFIIEQRIENKKLKEEKEQLKNYFKKRAECSNFQINKLKEEIAELQEDNVDTIVELSKENEQLRKKLECCEYEHLLNELDEIHEKVDKGDLSDFSPLKEDKPLNDYNPLKEKVHYWQCKYYKKDYEHKMDMCTRCNYGGLLNYCLKDKCDKMVKKDYGVTITEFENGVSIGWKKGVDKR